MKTIIAKITLILALLAMLSSCEEAEGLVDDLDLQSNGKTFNVDKFEQNIIDALDGNTTGYSYAINFKKRLHTKGAGGWAVKPLDSRDGNGVPQSPDKRMTIASLSKPITAVMALKLFEENNIKLWDPISNLLPQGWKPGPWVGNLEMEHLFRHQTGFHSAGGSYATCKGKYQQGINKDSIGVYNYENVNYAMFRVILPHLIDAATLGQMGYDSDEKLEETCFNTFFDYLKDDFLPLMEIQDAANKPEDFNPTLFYNFNDVNGSGWLTSEYKGLGPVGLYLSAHEIAAFLAYMRYDDNILSPDMRDLMFEKQLALRTTNGENGTYYSHGGDWWDGGGSTNGNGFTGEVMTFPIQCEAVVMVNNRAGSHSGLTTVLRQAYDDAWE